jgi:hypothetical protein
VPTDILAPASQRVQLQREVWFHGPVSRQEAETLLTRVSLYLLKCDTLWFGICEITQCGILQDLKLDNLAMRTIVSDTFYSNAFIYRSVINLFSVPI